MAPVRIGTQCGVRADMARFFGKARQVSAAARVPQPIESMEASPEAGDGSSRMGLAGSAFTRSSL